MHCAPQFKNWCWKYRLSHRQWRWHEMRIVSNMNEQCYIKKKSLYYVHILISGWFQQFEWHLRGKFIIGHHMDHTKPKFKFPFIAFITIAWWNLAEWHSYIQKRARLTICEWDEMYLPQKCHRYIWVCSEFSFEHVAMDDCAALNFVLYGISLVRGDKSKASYGLCCQLPMTITWLRVIIVFPQICDYVTDRIILLYAVFFFLQQKDE